MSIGGKKFHETRDEMLAEYGVVHRDGVGDGGYFVRWRPSHVGELVFFVGEGKGLDLHHAQALHGFTQSASKVMVMAWACSQRCSWLVAPEVFISVADGQLFNQVNRVQQVKPPAGHGEQQLVRTCTSRCHASRVFRSI